MPVAVVAWRHDPRLGTPGCELWPMVQDGANLAYVAAWLAPHSDAVLGSWMRAAGPFRLRMGICPSAASAPVSRRIRTPEAHASRPGAGESIASFQMTEPNLPNWEVGGRRWVKPCRQGSPLNGEVKPWCRGAMATLRSLLRWWRKKLNRIGPVWNSSPGRRSAILPKWRGLGPGGCTHDTPGHGGCILATGESSSAYIMI